MQGYKLQGQEGEQLDDQRGINKETISKLLIMRSIYKNKTLTPEEIYKPLGLIRAIFYRYAKILDNNSEDEIKKMKIK